MTLIKRLKRELQDKLLTNEEIDITLAKNKYLPIEIDEDEEEGILKYTNNRSQVWVRYIRDCKEYLVEDVTLRTKKNGNTKVRAFRTFEEIKVMMDYFRNDEDYDSFLIFVLGLFLARRIGDTISLKWSDFYHENGRKKEDLNTLVEAKTGKTINISITDVTWKYIDWYCEVKNIDPIQRLNDDIFQSRYKDELPESYSKKEYSEAINKQSASYRYKFKKAADYNNIENVSTHSTRKTFGYIAHMINKFDPDCLPVLQTVLGHNSIEDTKIYIDIMDEKAEKMYDDVANFIQDIDNGITPAIDNIPVVALKTNDLRDILRQAYMMGKNEKEDGIEAINELLLMVDRMRIS